jgi:hypothetical protein
MKTILRKLQRAPFVVLAALSLSQAVHAESGFLTTFNKMYGSSAS